MHMLGSLVFAALSAAPSAPAVTRYSLVVTLDPAAHRIAVEGTVLRPSSQPVAIHESKTIEHPIAKDGENPPFGEEHALLDLRLVAWATRARRQDHRVVVAGELGIGRV